MPICHSCDTAYLDSESHSCSTGPSDIAWAWKWAVAGYAVFRAVAGFRRGTGLLGAWIDTMTDPMFLILAVVAMHQTRRR
jgi:hypothetical protein